VPSFGLPFTLEPTEKAERRASRRETGGKNRGWDWQNCQTSTGRELREEAGKSLSGKNGKSCGKRWTLWILGENGMSI
jgi:hypothetical protein